MKAKAIPTCVFSLVLVFLAPSLQAQTLDYGDAPTINDTSGGGPARHLATGPMLGTLRDTEFSNVPSANADGDDLAGLDDEDGITFLTAFVPGSTAQVQIVVTGTQSARLSAYFDWDRNNLWNHLTAELALQDILLAPGTHVRDVPVPVSAVEGPSYARFKLYLGSFPLTPANGDHSSGEVEDYAIYIGQPIATEPSTWSRIKGMYKR